MSKYACNFPCDNNVMKEGRCECFNNVRAKFIDDKDHGIGSISISLHYCSTEERDELVKYLEENSWDFEEVSKFVRHDEEA